MLCPLGLTIAGICCLTVCGDTEPVSRVGQVRPGAHQVLPVTLVLQWVTVRGSPLGGQHEGEHNEH